MSPDPDPPSSESPGSPPAPRTRRLFGLDFIDDLDHCSTVRRLLEPQPTDDGLLPLVSTPNVDDIVRFSRAELQQLRSMVRRSRYVLPDGQPIVWTSRLAGRPLRARLTGSDFFPQFWEALIRQERPTLVIVSSAEISSGLVAEYPTVRHLVAPMFHAIGDQAMDEFVDRCVEEIEANRVEFVIIGIGSPVQQRIAVASIEQLRRRGSPSPVFSMLGASFAMHLGIVPRAPRWMRRAGLEWLHRFAMEPARLFRRYFVTDLAFGWMMLREIVAARRADHTTGSTGTGHS